MDAGEAIYEQMLVVRCQGGDESAFAELVGRYANRLRYFLRKMLRGNDAAEDALQDVWLDVYRNLYRLKDARAFRAWVYQVARDRAFRTMRRKRSYESLDEAKEMDAPLEVETFGPDDAAEVHQALDEIGEEHREVLLLRFVEEMNYEQIAMVVGCSVGTVRSRIHYGKWALREQIERQVDHERK